MPQDALLTPTQAAELVGVTPGTVRRWIAAGEVRALRLGSARNAPLRVAASELVERLTLAGPRSRDATD